MRGLFLFKSNKKSVTHIKFVAVTGDKIKIRLTHYLGCNIWWMDERSAPTRHNQSQNLLLTRRAP